MATTNDITDVVTGLVNTYITPKNPIYKVTYILSILDHDCLEAQCKSVLAEENNKTNLLGTNGNHATISKEIIKTWKQIIKNGFKPSIKLEDISIEDYGNYCSHHCEAIINIFGLERVA